VVRDGSYPIYRCFAERVFDVCREYAPAMESHLDEAFCDLTGTDRLYGLDDLPAGEPPRVAREIAERIREEVGLSVSVGIGRNRMLAKMASKSAKPAGVRRVDPAGEDAFLRPLPVRLLPGVGPRTAAVLAKLNIQTIEDLRALPRDSLKAMFGQNGLLLHERCRGEDTRVISAREIPRSISRETSFHQDTIASEEIEGMLHYLAERAACTLRKLGLKTRTIEVKLRYSDFQEAAGGRTLRTPTQIDGDIFDVALGLRRSLHGRRAALRHIGVTLSRFVTDDGTHPLDLFEGGDGEPGCIPGLDGDILEDISRSARKRTRSLSLCRSLDRIRERFGYSSVVSGKSIHLLGKLPQDAYGYILRTPCLTR
jgi:DNA polymerase-4